MLPLTQLHVETIDPLIGIIFFIVSVFLWKLQVPGESISLKCSHLQVTITDQGRWAFVGTHNCWNAVFDWKTASGALTKTKQSQNTTLPLLCDFFYHAFIYAFTWFYFYLNKKNLNTFRFGLWKCPTAIPGPAYVMAVIVNRGGAGWLYWAAVWRTVWVGILYARLTADQTEHNIVSWSVLVQAKLIFFFFLSFSWNLLPQRLHLPPDLSDTVSRSSKQDLAESARLLGPGCGMMAGGKKHLDF